MSQKCAQCAKPATVVFRWCASQGPQAAPLCDDHAKWWWDTYKHTAAGQSLSITNIPAVKENAA